MMGCKQFKRIKILGMNKINAVLLSVFVLSMGGAASTPFLEKKSGDTEFEPLIEFATAFDCLSASAPIRDHGTVRSAATLCAGVERLLSEGKDDAALQIIRANSHVVADAGAVLAIYGRCEVLALQANQVRSLLRNTPVEPLYADGLGTIQQADELMQQGAYEKAAAAFVQAEARCRTTAFEQLKRVGLDNLDELRHLDDAIRFRVLSALEEAEAHCETDSFYQLIGSHLRLAKMHPQWTTAIAAAHEKGLKKLESITDLSMKLAYLEELLQATPTCPVWQKQRKGLMANARFTSGQPWRNRVGMPLVYMPAGSFKMGSTPSENGREQNETEHEVTLSYGFFMGSFEVTRGQWDRVMDTARSLTASAQLPVDNVSWEDAQRFCQKLSEMEAPHRYRLPTEAEWEYACRAGGQTPYATGNQLRSTDAVVFDFQQPPESVQHVGQFAPNAWGLFDMHGNLAEWCQDWMGAYPSHAVVDPVGPADNEVDRELCGRVIRGGSWLDDRASARSACRQSQLPIIATDTVGFRVVLEADSVVLDD